METRAVGGVTGDAWTDLLVWLNDRGAKVDSVNLISSGDDDRQRILVAARDIMEDQPIISIPSSLLLNPHTIPGLLPQTLIELFPSELSSIQLLTLYLARHAPLMRSGGSLSTTHDGFEPYILTLPRRSPDVPLVWLIDLLWDRTDLVRASSETECDRLQEYYRGWRETDGLIISGQPFQLIFGTTAKQSEQVYQRFIEDWKLLCNPIHQLDDRISLCDLLWAWLMVNTRSVWYDLGCEKHEDNITLAPAIDMANHTSSSTVSLILTPHTLTMYPSYPLGSFLSPRSNQPLSSSKSGSLSSQKLCLSQAQQISFSYGPHSNATLLSEYGFVLKEPNPWDFIDITQQIEKCFESGDDPESDQKIRFLKQAGYWGDYTVQCEPTSPSHRVFVALRLLHLPLNRLIEWEDHLIGKNDDLGPDIEQSVRNTLINIFKNLKRSLRSRLNQLQNPQSNDLYRFECLRTIYSNELRALTSFIEDCS